MTQCCVHADEDHVLTAYRRYCTRCGCETKECHCGDGLNDSCPMHGGNRLRAKDAPAQEPTLQQRIVEVLGKVVRQENYYTPLSYGGVAEQIIALVRAELEGKC